MTAIGTAVRARLLVGCVLMVLAMVVVSTTAACGGSGSGSGGSGAAGTAGTAGTSGTETATNPSTEATGTEAPGRTQTGVSVSLPSLPVGGGATDTTVEHQCVGLTWIGSEFVDGTSVAVTRIAVDHPDAFAVEGGGGSCGGPNCSAPFTFSKGHSDCVVAVRALGTKGADATMTLSGTAHCTTAQKQWCSQVERGLGAIHLMQPSTSTSSSSSSSSSSSPTTTTTSSTTTSTSNG